MPTKHDIVIGKLTQVLSYLRQSAHAKKLKKDKGSQEARNPPEANVSILKYTGGPVPFMTKTSWDKKPKRFWEPELGREKDRDQDQEWGQKQHFKTMEEKNKHYCSEKSIEDDELLHVNKERGSTKTCVSMFVRPADWEALNF
jgi:hypothetical protein